MDEWAWNVGGGMWYHHPGLEAVRQFLVRRGFGWQRGGQGEHVLCSRAETTGLVGSEFRRYLDRYTFRRLLYWLIDMRAEGPFDEEFLSEKTGCNVEKVREYLSALERDSLVQLVDGRWTTTEDVHASSFGPTFESHVATLFNDDLLWHATHGVYLDEFDCNDFDVIAVHGSDIVHVECKITDKITEPSNFDTFHKRHAFLNPTLSLLLVDTNRPIKGLADKARLARSPQGAACEPVFGNDYLYWDHGNIYVGNTAKGVLRTLQVCLRHYYTRVHGYSRWA